MAGGSPKISVGIPVFNGEEYLAAALDSVMAQSFTDFEVVISDNASTDGTRRICEGYAEGDPRVRYYRNRENQGAASNFNRVFRLSRGRYFKWLAHDDEMAPEFLECCARVLDADPAIVMCHPLVTIIDGEGRHIGRFDLSLPEATSSKPHERFAQLVRFDRWGFEIFGLIRAHALKRTALIRGFVGSDRILRAELGLRGRFFEIPEYLMRSRDHAARSVRAMPAHHMRGEWFDPAKRGKTLFPHWRIFAEYLKAVHRAPVSRSDRRHCLLHMARWPAGDMNWARMAADLVIAAKPDAWEVFFRLMKSDKWLNAGRP
ncbi:MAG: glycosyltransferase family 2 protein [Deltaproteobacteria bacterium]|nr:glycosyltransferase family 2 protein [Deltaproteobacteria bacterium]